MSPVNPERREQTLDPRTNHAPVVPEQLSIVPVASGGAGMAPQAEASAPPSGPAELPASSSSGVVGRAASHTEHVTVQLSRHALLAMWTRATLALSGAGIAVALGARLLFERVVGAVPYEMPSAPTALIAIVLASATAAGFLGWTSETTDESGLSPATGKHRSAGNTSKVMATVLVAVMLRGAYTRRDDLSELNAPPAPLVAVEHRAHARPEHAASQLALGEAYFRAKRYADARGPLEATRMLASGGVEFTTMRYGDRTWLERVVPDKPVYTRATVLYTLTRAHLETDPRIALDYYREAYEIGDQSKEVTQELGDALMAQKRYVEAADVMRQYEMDRGPDIELARILNAADEAQRVIDGERLRSAPPSSLLGNTLIQRAQQRVRLAPDDPWTYSNLADAEIRAILDRPEAQTDDNFAIAAAHARQAVLLDPRKPEYLGQLGAILTFAKQYQAADSAFAEALAIDPGFFVTYPAYQNAQKYARAVAAGRTPPKVEPFGLYAPTPRP